MQSLTPCPSRACRPALGPGLRTVGGQNRKKPVESSHWLSLAAIPGEDRESTQAQLALSPNSGPRPVLRPPGFALPGPLKRPADPDSPGRFANSSHNRPVMGKFPSAGRQNGHYYFLPILADHPKLTSLRRFFVPLVRRERARAAVQQFGYGARR